MLFKRNKKERESEPRQLPNEPSFVARDTSFDGNITSDGEIHIDGEVRGSIRAHTCLIESHGEVHGGISAQYVVVRGRVIGPITATQVTIQSGAHVEGNVINENIVIENGAYVMGSITRSTLNHQPLGQDQFTVPPLTIDSEVDPENVLPMKLVK